MNVSVVFPASIGVSTTSCLVLALTLVHVTVFAFMDTIVALTHAIASTKRFPGMGRRITSTVMAKDD